MYKVSEVSPTAKCSPGISTEPDINSHVRVHYRRQFGYHNNTSGETKMVDNFTEKTYTL